MLAAVVAADDRQSFADCCSDHKRVGRAEAVLVGLGQRELLEVCNRYSQTRCHFTRPTDPQLTDVRQLLDGHLTRVGLVLGFGILAVDEERLVLRRLAIARELEGTAGGEPVGAPTDHLSLPLQTLVLVETRALFLGVSRTGRVLEADHGEDAGDGDRADHLARGQRREDAKKKKVVHRLSVG